MQDKSKMSNSISQSKMNVEPKVVSTQTTISSATIAADVKPQQAQAQTPDHKSYVTEMRKELSEASTATPTWSPSHNGHYLVSVLNECRLELELNFFSLNQEQHEYQTAVNLTKFNTHMNTNTSMTLSNTELNNICPHGKGSSKSGYHCCAIKYLFSLSLSRAREPYKKACVCVFACMIAE
jgi:hypothetical protein